MRGCVFVCFVVLVWGFFVSPVSLVFFLSYAWYLLASVIILSGLIPFSTSLLCERWVENYRGTVLFLNTFASGECCCDEFHDKAGSGELARILTGKAQCKDERGQACEGRGAQALWVGLSLESHWEGRCVSKKASWSSAWTVREAKP